MPKLIYATGCSFTNGDEIGEEVFLSREMARTDFCVERDPLTKALSRKDQAALDRMREENRYSAHLGRLIGCERVVNPSHGGRSNTAIVRDTIRDMADILRKTDPGDVFVVVQWSDPMRFDVWSHRHQDYLCVLPGWHETLDEPMRTYARAHLEHFTSETLAVREHAQNIIILQSFLKALGVPYVMFEHFRVFAQPTYDWYAEAARDPIVVKLRSLIDFEPWVFLAEPAPVVRTLRCGHFCTDTHKLWAERIVDFARERKILPR